MTKKTLWIIVIIAIVLIGIWLWRSRFQPVIEGLPQLLPVSEEDTTTQIQQGLEQIDLGDIDREFKNIDAELNNL